MNHATPNAGKSSEVNPLTGVIKTFVINWLQEPGALLRAAIGCALFGALTTAGFFVVPGLTLAMLSWVLSCVVFYGAVTIFDCWQVKDWPLLRMGLLITFSIFAAFALTLVIAFTWQRCSNHS